MKQRLLLTVATLLMSIGSAIANNNDYYFKTTVTASGAGKVYASESADATPDYQESVTVNPASQNAGSAPTKNIYLWAQPEAGMEVTWSTTGGNSVRITPNAEDPNRATAAITGSTNSSIEYQITATFSTQTKATKPVIKSADEQTLFWPSTEVIIVTPDEGAVIRYTLDGSDPTSESAAYTGPITISETTTVKAAAYVEGLTESDIASMAFTLGEHYDNIAAWKEAAPTGVTFITLTDAVVHTIASTTNAYIQDANTPHAGLCLYNGQNSILAVGDKISGVVRGTLSVNAGITRLGNWSLNPGYEKTSGSEVPAAELTKAALAENYDDYLSMHVKVTEEVYVSDVRNYTITVNDNGGIQFYRADTSLDIQPNKNYYFAGLCTKSTNKRLSIYSAADIQPGTPILDAPSITLPEGRTSFFPTATVTISAQENATIYYTVDGSEPTTESTVYTEPFSIAETTTVKAFATLEGWQQSAVSEAIFELEMVPADTPAITIGNGTATFWPTTEVTITAQEGAAIYYTLDGSTPTEESTRYTEPFSISETTTVKALAIAENYLPSAIGEATFSAVKPDGFIRLTKSSLAVFVDAQGMVPVEEQSSEGIVWSSSDPETVEVDAQTGAFVAKAVGTAVLTGELAENDLFTAASVTFTVRVVTPKYQVENGDFELWDDEGTANVEPAHWNSFQHASGSLASTVAAQQVQKSDDVRPGSEGTSSVRIYARNVFLGIAAQGNLTTGRINGGSITATDANGNYNYTDTENDDFHQRVTGLPDAIHVWVKSGSSIGGSITCNLHTSGDELYQDPLGTSEGHTNKGVTVVAHAENNNIARSDDWQELYIPFTYNEEAGDIRPEYALVTLTTSGIPGQGSTSDWMIIDDFSFIYNSELASTTYDENEVVFDKDGKASIDARYNADILALTSNGQGAVITTAYDAKTAVLTITVSGDDVEENANNVHTYTIQFSKPSAEIATATFKGSEAEFSADGKATISSYWNEGDEVEVTTVDADAVVEITYPVNEGDTDIVIVVKAADYDEDTDNTRTYVITLDTPTGIRGIASAEEGEYYDLAGRRVTTPRKGQLYIRGHQKVLVK